jgi:DNA helicase-2/ATP-dependent DNA helicase PcrA
MPERGDVPKWAVGLDPVQLEAVTHDGGPLLIVAGAGTGKTRTLVARLARLVDRGIPPERLLLVTFSRRAADEMGRRLVPLVGPAVARQLPAGTFHSIACRLLQAHARVLGLTDGFSVVDQGEAADLMHWARQESAQEGDRRRFPRKDTLLSIYSRVVNAQQTLREVLRHHFPWVQEHEDAIRAVFQTYADHKRARALLDFDDLLLYWRAACTDPVTGPALTGSFDHVLIDEYQDTNVLQADVVRSLHGGGCQITAVGDDAQAIYAFRAATVRNMLGFGDDFPGARIVTLEHNYRSTQPILDLANRVLADATEGYAKRLWTDSPGGGRPVLATCPDEGAQAEAVAEVILDHHDAGTLLREQAVLFRTAHHSDLLEVELQRRGIPYVKYGGLRFLEAAHIRDLLAALRIVAHPGDDLAWFRVLQLLDGVGPAGARRFVDRHVAVSGADPIAALASEGAGLPTRAHDDAHSLAAALTDCRRGDDRGPAVQIERLRLALDPILRQRYPDAEIRLRDFDALSRLAPSYGSITQMAAELTIDPPSSTGDLAGPPHLDDDYLILSTVHSAKGGEWRVVHMIHAADGMFPSDMSTGTREQVEEERRLFYVAMTRARDHLHIYAPLRYHHGGPFGRGDKHSFAQRTRFLPPAVDHLLDHRPVRTRDRDLPLPQCAVSLPSAVDEGLRALW